MSMDEEDCRREEAFTRDQEEHLRHLTEGPVFAYLAKYGDAIEKRVRDCIKEASDLKDAGFYGASLLMSAVGIEVVIGYFLVRPLVQGAFLSEEWAALLSDKVLKGRTADERELLPKILKNWGVDITQVHLRDGSQLWEQVKSQVVPCRNSYAHAGAGITELEASLAAECLDVLLEDIVTLIGERLGFTRKQTASWSVVISSFYPELNPPSHYDTASPF